MSTSRNDAYFHDEPRGRTRVRWTSRNQVKAKLGKSHFTIDPSAVAPPTQLSRGLAPKASVLFDAVPRNADFESLKPIISRLPAGPSEDLHAALSENVDSLDYILKDGVMYTQSRLPQLDPASRELRSALHGFRATTADYARGYLEGAARAAVETSTSASSAPHPIAPGADITACPVFQPSRSALTQSSILNLASSFNWDTLKLPLAASRTWYGVLFLSVRKADSESVSFYEADRRAHEEAVRSGGLIMYWYGSPNVVTGENLATCIWTSRAAAVEASKLPIHGQAARYARKSYDRYDLIRYKVVKRAGEPHVRLESWDGQDWNADE
ncbi:hypothetical protein BCV70DRAFT_39334 [Testicularia cyperi]|uniref:Uncharacterized protein n=1 Tax=Testicularia cyperi TaxID=1882483 RepID=A0A317XID9_9BASI|nr:hypothetical protein BCV70DRAFT_39334 [Testicularia cyperi]